MCGIAGFNWEDSSLIKKMTRKIRHRGPDDEGFFVDKGVSLGHRRLTILDLSKKGHQPMKTVHNEAVIIFNGEIYNYPLLKKELVQKGYRFKSASDTEAILYGYQEYGLGVLARLDGMFAFALWDRKQRKLILARDRVGKKPLYYAVRKGKITFASEIKALLENDEVSREISKQSISNFLTLRFSSGESTIFSNIKKIEPGTALIVTETSIKKYLYWSLPAFKDEYTPSKKEVDALIARAVKKRLLSDVPIGVFLSGGLDSTTLVSYMSRFTENIRTFSVGFKDGYTESAYARLVAKKYNTNHTDIILSKDILSSLPRVVWHLDEPLADPAALPTYLLSEAVSKKVKVALSGEGGDEVFGGYDTLNKIAILKKISKIPPLFSQNIIAPLVRAGSHSLHYPYKQMALLTAEITKNPGDFVGNTKRLFYFPFNASDKRALFGNNMRGLSLQTVIDSYIHSKKNIEQQVTRFYFKEWLPNDLLMKVDKMSMAHGLEVRAPFLDVDLVTYYAKLGIRYKLNRSLFRSVVANQVPKQILQRSKKGFTLPLSSWMQKRDFVQRIEPQMRDLQKRRLFKQEALEKLMKNPQGFRNDHRLWVLLNLELWYKEYVDGQKRNTIIL